MKQWLAFWALGLIWGSSFLLIKVGVEELNTFQLVSIRLAIASLLMLVYLIAAGHRLPSKGIDQLGIIFVGIFNVAVPFCLITQAEKSIDSSLATILNSTVPLFSLVIAHFALQDDKLTRMKIAGLLVGYLGVLILTSRGLGDAENSPLSAQIMMLLAVLSYAGAVVFIRARLRHLQPLTVAGSSLIVGAVVVIPLALVIESVPNFKNLSTDTILAMLTLGSLNTVIAYFLFYHLIAEWGARATMVTYTFPPVGITLGALLLHEPVDLRLIIGAAFILGGIFVVNYRRPTAVTKAFSLPQESTAAD